MIKTTRELEKISNVYSAGVLKLYIDVGAKASEQQQIEEVNVSLLILWMVMATV